MNPANIFARYSIVTVIWVMLPLVMLELHSRGAYAEDGAIFITIATVIGAVLVTLSLVNGTDKPQAIDQHAAAVRKRKNEESRVGHIDPMSLLTDEDIAELRADLKQRLRLQIMEQDESEMSTFEALLSEKEPRKTGRR